MKNSSAISSFVVTLSALIFFVCISEAAYCMPLYYTFGIEIQNQSA